MSTTYIVKIGNINLNVVPKSYNIKDVGRQINRMSFVNDVKVYYFDKSNTSQLADFSYRDISFSGSDLLAVCQSVEALYKAGNPVSFVDIYGNSYSNVIINSFNYNYIKAQGACEFSVELIIIASTSYVVKMGGSKVNGIESVSITKTLNESEVVGIGASRKVLVKGRVPVIYDINLSGIETFTAGTGSYTSTLSSTPASLTLPDGKTLTCLLVSKDTSPMPGVASFQKFSVKLIGVDSSGDMISSSFSSSLILSWSLSKAVNDVEVMGTGIDRKAVVKKAVPYLYNVTIAGIESVSGGHGNYTYGLGTTPATIVLPNGFSFTGILASINISSKQEFDTIQNYTVTFIGTDNPGDLITDTLLGLLLSWSVSDEGGRFSIHKTLTDIVVQKFDRVESYQVTAEILTSDKDAYVQGEDGTITLGGTTYPGIVTAVSAAPVERSILYRLSIGIFSFPSYA